MHSENIPGNFASQLNLLSQNEAKIQLQKIYFNMVIPEKHISFVEKP